MLRNRTLTLAAALVLAALPALARAEDKKPEMTENPQYAFWAQSKPGATATHVERVKFSGPEAKAVPGGTDVKTITYKLLEVTPDKVVVEATVTEQEFLGLIQQAPTKQIYPAKIPAAYLKAILDETGAKLGKETVKYKGKDIEVLTVTGKYNKEGEDIEWKRWYVKDIPGSIVKQVRKTSRDGKPVAESTTDLVDYSKGE